MKEKDTGLIPVVESDQNRSLIGVVTDRDLRMTLVAGGQDPRDAQVRDCMTTNMVSCHPDDDARKAADLMRANQIRRIPVVDQANTLPEVLSTADVARRSNLNTEETGHMC